MNENCMLYLHTLMLVSPVSLSQNQSQSHKGSFEDLFLYEDEYKVCQRNYIVVKVKTDMLN